MIESKILSLLPKSFFPNMVMDAKSGERFLKSLNKKIFIIISKTFYEKNEEKIKLVLTGSELSFFMLNNEPTLKDKEDVQNQLKKNKSEIILGIGGGSVMDLTKIVKMGENLECILIPTTIGSGSEASQYAVLLDENKNKKVFASNQLLPETVIFNPAFCATANNKVLAFSIVDALAHSIEGLASRNSNNLNDILATKSIDTILENGKVAYQSKDIEALSKLQAAGFIAGIVQSTASVGLIHGIAHNIGPKHGLTHGRAVSLYLLDVLRLNKKNSNVYSKLNSCKNVNESNFIEVFEKFLNSLELDLSSVYSADYEKIRMDICTKTNPCNPTIEDIDKIVNRRT
ncbi:MAG: iron-containing alcohol dehydrogenase [Nanoarchaeota archaeon]